MRAERSVVLTPVELRIARLVAVGRRNDEVAGELALSPKTVEWRLTRIYRKLGVRSRTELAAQLAGEAVPGEPPELRGSKDEPPSPFRFSVKVAGFPPFEAGPFCLASKHHTIDRRKTSRR